MNPEQLGDIRPDCETAATVMSHKKTFASFYKALKCSMESEIILQTRISGVFTLNLNCKIVLASDEILRMIVINLY